MYANTCTCTLYIQCAVSVYMYIFNANESPLSHFLGYSYLHPPLAQSRSASLPAEQGEAPYYYSNERVSTASAPGTYLPPSAPVNPISPSWSYFPPGIPEAYEDQDMNVRRMGANVSQQQGDWRVGRGAAVPPPLPRDKKVVILAQVGFN